MLTHGTGRGRKTLVLGEMKKPGEVFVGKGQYLSELLALLRIRFLSPLDAAIAILPEHRGVWYSPSVKIYVNLTEIIDEIDRAGAKNSPARFVLSRQIAGWALALEPNKRLHADPSSPFSRITPSRGTSS